MRVKVGEEEESKGGKKRRKGDEKVDESTKGLS
jgi:hypothetical protein